MPYTFAPASEISERRGCFVAVVGGTNSGKSWSGLEAATGLAGDKRLAVADTEGGRTLHLKNHFDFDALILKPPFRPHVFADVAADAEAAGYGALLIDSYSMEWAGEGGVLSWQEEVLEASVTRAIARQDRREEWAIREAYRMASWIEPKKAHKAQVMSLLTRRIPIVFSIRGQETVKPGEKKGDKPSKVFRAICDQMFPFELTVSFRLAQDRKGYIDLSDPTSWKMEEDHKAIFRHGDRITREHGAKLAAWARGEAVAPASTAKPQPQQSQVHQPRQTVRDIVRERLAAARTAEDVQAVAQMPEYLTALDKAAFGVKQELREMVAAAELRLAIDRTAPAPEAADGPPDNIPFPEAAN